MNNAQKTPEQLRQEFWENDIRHGGYIKTQYDEIKAVLADQDLQWVRRKYAEIKQHAINHTEFYKGYSALDEFPVVDKSSILANYEAHKADGGFETPVHISSTSGSTGTPFSVFQDHKKRMRTIADLKAWGERCDYPSHERMILFRVLSDKLRRTPEQEARENIYYVDASDLGDEHLEEMKQVIVEKEPRIIFGYASTLVELAKYIKRAYNPIPHFSMRSILTAGEGISAENQMLLTEVFGCKLYRRYADMELGILAQDTGEGDEFALNFGSFYFECLKIDSNEPTDPGEVGRIVITDLFNLAFPMIRYDTGDLGIMEYREGEFPVLKEIFGRKRDCVYSVDGRIISPAKISVSMWGVSGIKQWQFIQETKCQYTLKLNADADCDIAPIIDKIKSALGADAIINIEYVDEIPVLASNKRRAVICNYQKG